MNPLKYFDALAQQVATHAVTLLKLEWRGGDSLAADRFIQIHDAYTAPANGAVPLLSWSIYTGAPGYKLFDVGELQLTNGLYVCVSTTEATKTLATGNDKFASLFAELLEEEQPQGTSLAGDLTTDVGYLSVWNNATGPKTLFEIITTNNDAADHYLQIHAPDLIATSGIVESFLVPAGQTKRLSFGRAGRSVFKLTGATLHQGCLLAYSTTQSTYTPPAGNIGPIYAEYKD